jgi:hypothetical protein
MKEPSNGPTVRIADHQDAGVPFPMVLDQKKNLVRPAIIWADQRSADVAPFGIVSEIVVAQKS